MICTNGVDIKENSIEQLDYELLTILLQDKSSGKNIIWATDDYSQNGYGFRRTAWETTGKKQLRRCINVLAVKAQ